MASRIFLPGVDMFNGLDLMTTNASAICAGEMLQDEIALATLESCLVDFNIIATHTRTIICQHERKHIILMYRGKWGIDCVTRFRIPGERESTNFLPTTPLHVKSANIPQTGDWTVYICDIPLYKPWLIRQVWYFRMVWILPRYDTGWKNCI